MGNVEVGSLKVEENASCTAKFSSVLRRFLAVSRALMASPAERELRHFYNANSQQTATTYDNPIN